MKMLKEIKNNIIKYNRSKLKLKLKEKEKEKET